MYHCTCHYGMELTCRVCIQPQKLYALITRPHPRHLKCKGLFRFLPTRDRHLEPCYLVAAAVLRHRICQTQRLPGQAIVSSLSAASASCPLCSVTAGVAGRLGQVLSPRASMGESITAGDGCFRPFRFRHGACSRQLLCRFVSYSRFLLGVERTIVHWSRVGD